MYCEIFLNIFSRNYCRFKKKALPFATQSREIATKKLNGALVQLVRIHACHAWGHGFESRTHRLKVLGSFRIKDFFLCFLRFRQPLTTAIRMCSESKQGNLYTVFCDSPCLFYVSGTGTLRFSCRKRRFLQREPYVSRSGNVKNAFPCFFYLIVLFILPV